MALHMRFGSDDLLRCRFALSPLCETHEAVRTLHRPERHGYHLPWLRRMRSAVAGLDLRPLWLFMPQPGYTPDFLGRPPATPSPSFEDELALLRGTDPALAREEMARSLAFSPGATRSPLARELLADPAGAIRRLADLTEQAWRALLAPDWPRLRTLMESDIAYRSRRLAIGGLQELFADLHPKLVWADGTLTLRTRAAFPDEQRLDGQGVLMMPSIFVWPDPVSGFAAPWQPTVIYPARGMGGLWQTPQAPSDALVRLVGRTRAAILGALDEPASTTALADRHGLALSSVSAHLSVLRDAGLLSSRRQGHQVLYERTALGIALAGAQGGAGARAEGGGGVGVRVGDGPA
jgi:DNA-binding transcriptional ArsR family regulator